MVSALFQWIMIALYMLTRNILLFLNYCSLCCISHYTLQRWVRCYQDKFVHSLVSTTNGVERQHERLKYSYLAHVSGGSLTDLVMVVVKQLVPDSERRYVSSPVWRNSFSNEMLVYSLQSFSLYMLHISGLCLLHHVSRT